MKKTISCIMIICVLVSLGGCVWDPASYLFDYDELKEQIATVELINYENDEPEKIDDDSKILPYDFNKEEVLETLAVDKIDDFTLDLSEIRFMDYSVAYGLVEVFDSNGYPIERIGEPESRKDYVALVNKYFEYKIK